MLRAVGLKAGIVVGVAISFSMALAETGSAAPTQDGGPLIVGQYNWEAGATTLQTYGNLALELDSDQGRALQATGASIGVYAEGNTYGVYAAGTTGVYGHGSSNGVFGQTSNGSASGVYGENDGTGYGVAGSSASGVGVLAQSGTGTALQVSGIASFSRSGVVTIPTGSKSVTIGGVALSGSSLVLATLQTKGNRYVQSAVPDVAGAQITIQLNKPPLSPQLVAWFVVN